MDVKDLAARTRSTLRNATKTPGDVLHGLTVSVRVTRRSLSRYVMLAITSLDEADVVIPEADRGTDGWATDRAHAIADRVRELAIDVYGWADGNDRMRFVDLLIAGVGAPLPRALPAVILGTDAEQVDEPTLRTLTHTGPDGEMHSADDRFYAYHVPALNSWVVRDAAGHYFVGGGGKVATLAIADDFATGWAQDAEANPNGRGARAGAWAVEQGRWTPNTPGDEHNTPAVTAALLRRELFETRRSRITAMNAAYRALVLAQLGEDEVEALLEDAVLGDDATYRDQVICRYTELRPDLGPRARAAADRHLVQRTNAENGPTERAVPGRSVLAGASSRALYAVPAVNPR